MPRHGFNMKATDSPALLRYLPGLSVALAGALLANLLSLPIPWLLGSLLLSAAANLKGLPVKAPAAGRKIGVCIIGLSLGRYFTPQMVEILLSHWSLLLFGTAFALLLGIIGSRILYRYADVDFRTAWYASAIGGASEIAYLADKSGAQAAKVVSVHSLRVLLVVTIIPFFYQYMGYHDTDSGRLNQNAAVHWGGLLLLFALGYVFARLFEWRKWSNPWTFGPLFAALLLTVNEIHLSAIPPSVSHIGQLLIGWSLGNRFAPGFFRSAPRLLAVAGGSICLSLLLTAATVYCLSQLTTVPLPTLGLGLAPGGVAEMTITAKVLHLGVPLVTALHVSRLIIVVSTAGMLCRFFEKRMAKPAKT